MRPIHLLHLAVLTLWLPLSTSAETIKIAVAANFTSTMNELVAEFEKSSGHKVDLSSASTGKIYAQIVNGAPYQAFFAADQTTPEKLESAGKAVPGSRFTYAIGALALWSAKPNFIDEQLQVLKTGQFNKIALANPKLAPYGAAAVEALEKLDLVTATQAKWVQGENIAQTYQFVFTGNADLGFVALSQIMQNGKLMSGSYWQIPTNLHTPILQDAQILLPGKNSFATQQFMEFIQSDLAKAIIQFHGYQTADEQ
jgi:molybdenum ABC transporter, periplasmic molybdate-binding protein